MNYRLGMEQALRASCAGVAVAFLVSCGGDSERASAPTQANSQLPATVQMSETATALSVRTEYPTRTGRSLYEAQAMNFVFEAKVSEGPDAGKLIGGRLELKAEREDQGLTVFEGRLFPDVDPSLPTPNELKDQFNADRKALRTAMREDIKVLSEELRAAIAAGTPPEEAKATFRLKFDARMAKYRTDLSTLIADYRTARRNAGWPGDDDDVAAHGFEVHGTISAGGAVDMDIDLGAAGTVHATGMMASDGTAQGDFTGPASGDKGQWKATASESAPPPPPPTSGSYEAGLAKYKMMCAGCHSAGAVDTTGTAGDLAKEADDIVSDLGRADSAMAGMMLTAQEIIDLKAFLRQADTPPPSAATCAAQDLTWSQGASTCNAAYAGGVSGSSAALADIAAPTTGSATASCSNGTVSLSAALCSTEVTTPPAPGSCAAQTLTWTQGTSSCSASYAGGASGTSAVLTDATAPTTGTATASCTNAAVTLSAALCSTAAAPTGSYSAGLATYNMLCASCHRAGTVDTTGAFIDLKGKQDLVVTDLGPINPMMDGMFLTDQQVADLKAFLAAVP